MRAELRSTVTAIVGNASAGFDRGRLFGCRQQLLQGSVRPVRCILPVRAAFLPLVEPPIPEQPPPPFAIDKRKPSPCVGFGASQPRAEFTIVDLVPVYAAIGFHGGEDKATT